MYRNIVYNSQKRHCIIFSWDEKGEPIHYTVPFKPYIYLLSNNKNRIDAYSIFNEPLVKKEFETQSERYRFLQNYEYPRIYHNLDVQQQCLVDLFWQQNESDEFSKNLLNVGFIDIETYSPNGFPNPLEAPDEINAVTLYCSYTKKYYVFGCKPFENKWDDVEYVQCNSERHLLQELVKYISDLKIDVLSAWNGEGFDFPYIGNRISRVCGEEWVKKLSPAYFDDLFVPVRKHEVVGDRGEIIQKWNIEGLSLIDYMIIYKKYTYADRPSFALNYIANAELGDQKIEHNGLGLHELADKDWQKFVEYNIQDVRLLVKLDAKLKFINLLKMQSYIGLTTLEKTLGTISVTLGALAVRCKYKNKILHTKIKFDKDIDYEGGYVKEPVAGFCDDVVSYDANSLYPNTVISLNISPETKLGKIVQEDEEFVWFKSNKDGKIIKANKKDFLNKCKANKIAVSKSNVLFSQNVVGIIPEFMDFYYKGRVETKKLLKQVYKQYENCTNEKEKKQLEDRIEYLDLLQLAQKITLNSAYGALGASFCPINDVDLSSSITLTGQAVVKQAGEIARQFCNNYGIDYDPVRYGDTDSVVGDTKIIVNDKEISIRDYYNQCNGKLIKNDTFNEQYVKEIFNNDKALSLKDNKMYNGKILYIMKHKVKKEFFKISYNDKEVIVTSDHSILVKRDGKLKSIKPSKIKKGDKIIIIE